MQAAFEHHHSEKGNSSIQFHQFFFNNIFLAAEHKLAILRNVPFLYKLPGSNNSQKEAKQLGMKGILFPPPFPFQTIDISLLQLSTRTLSPSDSNSLTRLLKIASQLKDMYIISGKHFWRPSNNPTAQSDAKRD